MATDASARRSGLNAMLGRPAATAAQFLVPCSATYRYYSTSTTSWILWDYLDGISIRSERDLDGNERIQ
jgi:hypothetical protein